MKIYISGSFAARERLRPMRDKLWAMGHEITSSWLDEVARPTDMEHSDFFKKLGYKDIAEIVAADLLISDRGDPSTSGGTFIEFGVALGQFAKCQIWLVGAKASPFDELSDKVFASWDDLLAAINPGPPHPTK